jgi:16S rRNA (guanine527-N7)-methyltransferase
MEELIFKYFPNLSRLQRDKITALGPLYRDWNQKINLISRKDIDNLYLHHILHSLSVAKLLNFPDGAKILDVGTGGGFPGIPLAILFPHCHFYLCDSILKKIGVVNEIKDALLLENVYAKQVRAEEIDEVFDFVVSRAVTDLSTFLPWVWKKVKPGNMDGVPRGVLYLKGGFVNDEISLAAEKMKIKMDSFSKNEINSWFEESWFEEKSIIFIKR